MREKVLITGATGFIGSHLFKRFRQLPGFEVVGTSRRIKETYNDGSRILPVKLAKLDVPHISDENMGLVKIMNSLMDHNAVMEIRDLMNAYQPDIVFHLAANATVANNGREAFYHNINMTEQLIAHAKPECRFVHASSATVYGPWHGKPHSENDALLPSSLYGASKVASENLIDIATFVEHKIRGVNLRLCATVGDGATHGLVKDVVAKLDDERIDSVDLIGDCPGSKKPFIYIDDVINAMVLFGNSNDLMGAYNICTENPITVEEVAAAIMLTKCKVKPIKWKGWDANWSGDDTYVSLSNSKAKSIGWYPEYNSTQAIAKAVK